MDYKDSLNLPQTSFPMKADLPKREPDLLKKWEEENLYQKIIKKNKNEPRFTLHDGPPYANSPIHIGTALNKILKDIVVRYKNMSGFRSEYIPGWDCHGLPIELAATQKLGGKKKDLSPLEIKKLCREHASHYIEIQKLQFKRLGVMGEWNHPYLTMNFDYEAQMVRELGKLIQKKLVQRGKKVIHWCAFCQTALAEAEIEYEEKSSPSIYVKFQFTKQAHTEIVKAFPTLKNKNISMLIWTTTPWTLPANLAIAIHPDFKYVAVEDKENEIYIVAKNTWPAVQKECGLTQARVVAEITPQIFEFLRYQHPFLARESIILFGTHVTEEGGTGAVHTAPGHGVEDYFLGLKHGLRIYSPVDHTGHFSEDIPGLQQKFIFDANAEIITLLRSKEALIHETVIRHSYPHCWRCKKPVFFRATEQWFVLMDNEGELRKEALSWIKKVKWVPEWGQHRIESMMASRPDWCISRQRVWGVPIPALRCKACSRWNYNEAWMQLMANRIEKEGADFWFSDEASSIVPSDFSCASCGKNEFEKEKDILDVWFDSGCSFASLLEKNDALNFPADLYLEGSDQHRGWFHTSLLIAAGTRRCAPYKTVLTHGFVVDGEGRKMSKSLGNVVDPLTVIDQHGAEILRLWVASENYQNDVPCSSHLLQRCSETYRKIRNTCKFILGNLYDFDPNKDKVSEDNLLAIDKFALYKLHIYVEKANQTYMDYEFQNFIYLLNNFCTVDLSSFYLDILKDRLYTFGKKSMARRAAQTVLYEILTTLIRTMAPILIFTSEEVLSHLKKRKTEEAESVHLLSWPEPKSYSFIHEDFGNTWEKLLSLRDIVLKELEIARQSKLIGNSLEAKVILTPTAEWKPSLDSISLEALEQLFIVSQVKIEKPSNELRIAVNKAEGTKCPRCWMWSTFITDKNPLCQKCEWAISS